MVEVILRPKTKNSPTTAQRLAGYGLENVGRREVSVEADLTAAPARTAVALTG